jgi:hypothetical protein
MTTEVLSLRRLCLTVILAITLSILLSLGNADNTVAQEDTIILRGNLVPISARLLQNGSYGDPVGEQRLDFYDYSQNSFIGFSMTDSDGYATVYWNLALNHSLGPTLLNVTFEGNDTFSLAPSCQWTTVIVVSGTQIDIQYDHRVYYPGNQIPLLVKLSDDHSEAIADALIAVYHNDMLLATGLTNETGYIIFNLECNTSWCSLGNNDIKVVYEPLMTSHHNSSEYFIGVEVQQIMTSIQLEDLNGTQFQLDEFLWMKLSASAAGKGFPNAILDILLDGSPIDTATTDAFGMTESLIHINHRLDLGLHRVKIEYGGTDRHTAASLEIDIVVTSPAMVSVVLPDYAVIGADSQIQLEIHDSFGRPVPGAIITIHDEVTNETQSIPVPLGHTTTQSNLIFTGPTGVRGLLTTISGNPYLTNTTWMFWITVWLKPTISIAGSNVFGYASPGQWLSFRVHLNSNEISLPDRLIEGSINETILPSQVTDSYGFTNITLHAPETQGRYILLLKANGSSLSYELSAVLEYTLIVSRVMPVQVSLKYYITSPELRELRVCLMLRCLNGTILGGVTLYYEWLSNSASTITMQSGLVELILPIPTDAGIYSLYYSTDGTDHLFQTSGHSLLTISETQVLAAQGIGIPGLVLTLFLSLGLLGIPAVYRRHLIG